MGPAANLDWLYHLLGFTLAAAGVLLLLWALFWDRSRGRKRCPKCWFDMAATPGFQCPECGREARSEQRLFKTRRRWRLAALSLILVSMAYIAHSWPQIRAGGWTAPIPTGVLLEIYPWAGPGTALGDALLDRYHLRIKASGNVAPSDEQLATIITRASRGTWRARPVSQRWQKTWGVVLTLLDGRVMKLGPGLFIVHPGPHELKRAIPAIEEWLRVPPVVTVRTRAKWPRGMPISIEVEPRDWWPNWVRDVEELTWSASVAGTPPTPPRISKFRTYCEIEVPLEGQVTVKGTLKVFARQYQVPEPVEALAAPFRIEYQTVETIDDAMTAVGSAELNEFLAANATAVFDPRLHAIKFNLSKPMPIGYDDVAFGAKLEVLAGERVLMTAYTRSVDIGRALSGWGVYGNVNTADNDPDAEKLVRGELDPAWRVRVRTDPQWALSELDAQKYWKGEFTVPVVAQASPAPRRGAAPSVK